jgi:hypothetical protein
VELKKDSHSDKPPSLALYQKAGAIGFWALRLGPGPYLAGKTFFGVAGEQISYLHEMIVAEEVHRLTLALITLHVLVRSTGWAVPAGVTALVPVS